MLTDVNAALGPWPFAPLPARTGVELQAHLACAGINRALVSHLGAVFLPDPMPANRELFAAVRRCPSLVPVPVLNPVLPAWREQFAECRAAAPVRAVKLLPNYHGYSLRARALDAFMAEVAGAGLRVILNIRLEDQRHTYFALRVRGVPVADVAAFLRRFPTHHVLCTGLSKPEIETLAAGCDNFSADIAFAEWLDTLELLLKKIPARRLLLGTNTPLFAARAQADKLRCARLPAKTKALIGAGNARRLFSI